MKIRAAYRLAPLLLAGPALALAACSKHEPAPVPDNGAEANGLVPASARTVPLIDGSGKPVGSVDISEDKNGVTLRLSAAGLAAGPHGVHLHEKGLCDAPDFKSAGAHWNPEHRQHGRDNPAGAHLGDLANVEAGAAGASSVFLVGGVTESGSANALADADGTSLVVHAKADDYKTDPSGDSGDRIACAVLVPPR